MTTLELFNGDCLEVMKNIPNASVDLIICDLPYGCLMKKAIQTEEKIKELKGLHENIPGGWAYTGIFREGCQWDVKINLEQFWEQVKRIRKNNHSPCIHFCSTRFGVDLINSNPKEFRYDMVWNKMRGVGFLIANKKPMASHEMIYVFGKEGAAYNRIDIEGEIPYFKKSKEQVCEQYNVKRKEGDNKGTRCVLSIIEQHNTAGHNGGKHPTAKPAELYKWLISRYSKEGDTVLDPTFGSCNSGAVAMELNRNFIGIEMNEAFYDKAVERFNGE